EDHCASSSPSSSAMSAKPAKWWAIVLSSPSSLLQNELIQRQIRNRLAQPAVLEFKVQALHSRDGLRPATVRVSPLSRCSPFYGLVHLRQTFARRCHERRKEKIAPEAGRSSFDEGQCPSHGPRCGHQYDCRCEHQTKQTE